MAAPITHILQAEIIYDKYFYDKSRSEFFIGTCFPDIRLTGVIDEEKTHFDDLVFKDLKNESPFWAGVKFHSIVDNYRKDFLKEHKIYDSLPRTDFIKESLKLFEDEYYYSSINDLPTYSRFMEDVLPEELKFGIKEKDIKNWHALLASYLSTKPNRKSRIKYHLDMGFRGDAIKVIENNLIALRTDENAIESCKKFCHYILARIENQKKGRECLI